MPGRFVSCAQNITRREMFVGYIPPSGGRDVWPPAIAHWADGEEVRIVILGTLPATSLAHFTVAFTSTFRRAGWRVVGL